MKHIVFVIGNYKNGGVAMHSTNLANEFAKKGYACTILVTGEMGKDVFFELRDNVKVVSVSEYTELFKENKDVLKYLKKQQAKIKFFKTLRYITRVLPKFDLLLAEEIRKIRKGIGLGAFATNHRNSIYIPFGIDCYLNAFFAIKPLGCKIIYAERNASEVEIPKNERERLIKLVCKANGVVLQTENELAFYGNKLKNAAVINNPVKAGLPERFTGERRKIIVNFCRISSQKNLYLLVNAFSLLKDSHPDYTLEIYGNTVAYSEETLLADLKKYVTDKKMNDSIKFFPARADIHNVVKDCAMFVSSSDYEGLSNSMLESLAIGLPCVCTDCLGGGARELITDGENGLLVPMQDPESLYLAIKRFIEDSALSEKCSQNAVKVRDTHSAEKIAGKWLRYIESVI